MSKYDFEKIKEYLLSQCKEQGWIPTGKEIKEDTHLPSVDTVREIFKQNGYNSHTEFLREMGYKSKSNKGRPLYITYEQLCNIWESFFEENNRYPTSEDCNKIVSLPTWTTVKKVCGDKFNDFYDKYGNGMNIKTKDYDYYCELFKKVCEKEGKVLTIYDLLKNNYDIPNSRWLVSNCPDKNVHNYNDFISYLGLKPYYNITKKYAIEQIKKKYKKLNRPLKVDDFYYPQGEEIGIKTIINHWGTFNNMLKYLGLPTNQEDMTSKHRTVEELKNDINKLCDYIFKTENRRNITRDDVENSERCLSSQSYDRWFKIELNMNLNDYISSIGYEPNKAGMGMIYKFSDGEITTSKFEYIISKYLKEHKVKYIRNVRYNSFIEDYNGNKDCDYVLDCHNQLVYIEVAGMLDYTKVSKKHDDKIRSKYKKDLKEKEKMLKQANLQFMIIYPLDLQEKSLDEIFSFLHIKQEIN